MFSKINQRTLRATFDKKIVAKNMIKIAKSGHAGLEEKEKYQGSNYF